jgi:transposase
LKAPLGHTFFWCMLGFARTNTPKGADMRFYTKTHKHYCGIDLHAKKMYLCILDASGNVLLHRNIASAPESFLKAVAPFRDDLVVGVECMFAWYWLADLCRKEGIEFILGHALFMKAVHGGKTKNDKIDSHKIAVLLRGGMFPVAYVYPPEMRATRDLLRRRCHLVRKKAELLAHIQNTSIQYNLPEIDVNLSLESSRIDVDQHFPDTEVRKIVQIDLAMIDAYDDVLKALEWDIEKTARNLNRHALLLLRSINGIGQILSLVMLYEIHDIHRFETVQDFASYCRLVKCAHESAGKKKGVGGAKMGNPHLKWAFSEAAVMFIRHNSAAKKLAEHLTKMHGKGKGLAIIAHKLARAIYYMLRNNVPFNLEKFLATA